MSTPLLFFLDAQGTANGVVTTLGQVGALLRARTRDQNGVEQGTFTAGTRPTDVEAQTMVDMATAQVAAVVGGQVPVAAADAAQQAVALRAAVLIESSYNPEQVASGDSPIQTLQAIADAQLQALLALTEGDQQPGMGIYSVPVVSSVAAAYEAVLNINTVWDNPSLLP